MMAQCGLATLGSRGQTATALGRPQSYFSVKEAVVLHLTHHRSARCAPEKEFACAGPTPHRQPRFEGHGARAALRALATVRQFLITAVHSKSCAGDSRCTASVELNSEKHEDIIRARGHGSSAWKPGLFALYVRGNLTRHELYSASLAAQPYRPHRHSLHRQVTTSLPENSNDTSSTEPRTPRQSV